MARRFVFKLQKVLEYRGQLEDQARMALARAQAEHDAQAARVAAVRAELDDQRAKGVGKTVTPAELWLRRQYLDALARDLERETGELNRLALKLQHARREAVRKSRDRKLLEKLKENQARTHDEEERLREAKENDEMSALRHEPADF